LFSREIEVHITSSKIGCIRDEPTKYRIGVQYAVIEARAEDSHSPTKVGEDINEAYLVEKWEELAGKGASQKSHSPRGNALENCEVPCLHRNVTGVSRTSNPH